MIFISLVYNTSYWPYCNDLDTKCTLLNGLFLKCNIPSWSAVVCEMTFPCSSVSKSTAHPTFMCYTTFDEYNHINYANLTFVTVNII